MNRLHIPAFACGFLAAVLAASCLKPIECHTLTARALDPATGSVTGAGIYADGASVLLVANPGQGFYFDRWTDDNRDNPRSVVVSGDGEYVALFHPGDGSGDDDGDGGSGSGGGSGGGGGGNPQEGDGGFDKDGATKSRFSVSATRQVRFARGNLQYNPATGVWRFAEHQYDRIGQGNANISSTYNGWLDLFAWATSGWESGAVSYQPWSVSTNDADYYPSGEWNHNLTGAYAEADWAWHNPISNGGNRAHMWRTMTADEWKYLIVDRPDAASKIAMSTVGGQHGLVILPDAWTPPPGLAFNAGMCGHWGWNVYTLEQWARMEKAGAVFLPTTGGRRGGNHVVEEDESGFYISSTINSPNGYKHLSFSTQWYYAPGNGTLHEGQGLRPILD